MKYKLRGNFSKDENCIESVLSSRRIEDLSTFMNPSTSCNEDYHHLDNIERGADLLIEHLRNGSNIYLLIDPDVDGMTSSAIMWQYIKAIDPDAHITFDVQEGKRHGLEHKIDYLINQAPHYDLVILPDSSSNDIEELEQLNNNGIQALCIDHHICDYDGYDKVPSNTILINNQQSQGYHNKTLCGAGMVYKFCQCLDDKLEINFADRFLDLAALGEIADVMSKTTSETNYIIQRGLTSITNGGIKELLKVQNHSLGNKAFYPYEDLNSIDVAFYIAPLINAIVRMGTREENKLLFLGLVQSDVMIDNTSITKSYPNAKETTASQMARLAVNRRAQQNRARDKSVEYLVNKIEKENLNKNKIILIGLDEEDEKNITKEITGLIASNLVGIYKKPVLLLHKNTEGMLQGSGRGNDNFEQLSDLKGFLEDSGCFSMVAGHANANGLSINSTNVDEFINYSNTNISDTAFDSSHIVDYEFDAFEYELPFVGREITEGARFFGNGVDEVVNVVHNIPLANAMILGENQNTTKIICGDMTFLRFKDENFATLAKENKTGTVDIVGKFSVNVWNGHSYLQIIIDDYSFNYNDIRFDF